jgi:hypothetical protein
MKGFYFNITILFIKVHGLENSLELRKIEGGLQMGDQTHTPEPTYLPRLILPKLPFPNRFYGYTRFRPQNRSIESAYWDRVLPILNAKWKQNTSLPNHHHHHYQNQNSKNNPTRI